MAKNRFTHSSRSTTNVLRLVILLGILEVLTSCDDQGKGSSRDSAGAGADRPNVLFIVVDTSRQDFFSCYDHPRVTTPNVDRLASEGVRFTRAFSTDYWTLPSHASLLTGLFPTEVQATSETLHLPEQATTLAERLGKNGYRTGAVVENAWISKERGFGQGFEYFEELWQHPRTKGDFVRSAVGWLDAQLENDSPFFLFCNINVPHLPYDPPAGLRNHYVSSSRPQMAVRRLMRIKALWGHYMGKVKLTENDFQIMRELYAAELALADAWIGQLIEALRKKAALDNSVVVVTSDHGENIGDHGMIDHLLSMYDTTLHVPLVIRYPDRFDAGAVRPELVSIIDVVPTILDACGLLDDEDPGFALRSLCSERRLRRDFVVAENDRPLTGLVLLKEAFPSFDASTIDFRRRMVRTERYKLVWQSNGHVELFDLANDPGETTNIADSQLKAREQLARYLDDWTRQVEDGKVTESAPTFASKDAKAIEQLRALGYVHDDDDNEEDH